jgi:hypothetical protein
MNLGRSISSRASVDALREFEAGVRAAPGGPGAAKALHSLRAR